MQNQPKKSYGQTVRDTHLVQLIPRVGSMLHSGCPKNIAFAITHCFPGIEYLIHLQEDQLWRSPGLQKSKIVLYPDIICLINNVSIFPPKPREFN